jgi:hypothetical protein
MAGYLIKMIQRFAKKYGKGTAGRLWQGGKVIPVMTVIIPGYFMKSKELRSWKIQIKKGLKMVKKRIKSKRKISKLTEDQYWDLALMDCFDKRDPHHTFKSPQHRKELWEAHKEEIMQDKENKTCGAWWQYESKLGHYPDKDGMTEEKYFEKHPEEYPL